MNEDKPVEPVALPQTEQAPKPETASMLKPTAKPTPKAKAVKKVKPVKGGTAKPKAVKATKTAKAVKTAKPKKATTKAAKPSKKLHSSKYPRHAKNPFRDGSGYALCFDVLASHKGGMNRADLTAAYSLASKKPLKNASFDVAVVLSPKSIGKTCERHKSCREGYGIRREGSHVELVLP